MNVRNATSEIVARNRHSIAASETDGVIVDDCKAWSVLRFGGAEMKLRHGDRARVLVNGRWVEVSFGTTVGYALANGEDPHKAIERANGFGHGHHWVNLCAVALTAWDQPKESFIGFEFGDAVTLEGVRFILRPASNGNVALERV